MPTATVYFVVLRSDSFPGLDQELSGAWPSRARAERAAANAQERCAAYERVEILEEVHSFIEDPALYANETADHCLCCGLLKAKRPALPPWMTAKKEDA